MDPYILYILTLYIQRSPQRVWCHTTLVKTYKLNSTYFYQVVEHYNMKFLNAIRHVIYTTKIKL